MTDKATRRVDLHSMRRLAPLGSVDVEARTAELVWSTGVAVRRYNCMRGEEFYEELSLDPKHVRLDRLRSGAPLLNAHGQWELKDIIGVVESAELTEGEGRASVRFSTREEVDPIFRDVREGIIRNVSVGYILHRMLDTGETRDGLPVYRAIDWEPTEISLVPIGADAQAGVRSEAAQSCYPCEFITANDAANQKEHVMAEVVESRAAADAAAQNIETARDDARRAEALRITEILATGENFAQHGGSELASRAVRDGKDLKWLTDELLKRMSSQPESTGPNIGLSDKEVKRYSVSRAIIGLLRAKNGEADAWKAAGFERECHFAAEKACVREAQHGGFLVPFDVQHARGLPWQQQRDLTTTPGSAGGYLVSTTNQPQSFIELLRNSARVLQAGVTVLPGLKDNITIPKQTGASTLYWLANESTAITESNLTFGQIALSPKNAGAYVEISHQLMQQSAPAADALVWADFARVGAIGIDTAVLNGSGASGQPLGILGAANTGSVTGTSIDFAKCLEFQTDVAGANALTDGFSYLTTPTVASLLMQRVQFTGTASPLWVGSILDGRLLGLPARASTNVPSATMIGGDFSQILMGEWGTMELALNPYANFTAGIVGLRMWLTIDVAVRQPGAFSIATSIT